MGAIAWIPIEPIGCSAQTAAGEALTSAALAPGAPASSDVAPQSTNQTAFHAMVLLKRHCFGCHNEEKRKGDLVLTSREAMLKGGENGPVLIPGNSAESRMAQLVVQGSDPHMPPKDQLAPDEIRSLRRWIDEGAVWDAQGLALAAPSVGVEQLGSLPNGYHPVLALALSPDGSRLAVGRGDSIWMLDAQATNLAVLGRLSKHRDVVQSLAWSSDGKKLASGGFQRVLVWAGDPIQVEREWTKLEGRVTAVSFMAGSDALVVAHGAPTKPASLVVSSADANPSPVQWTAHGDSIFDAQISPDGERLATASADKRIKLWNLANHTRVQELEGHTGPVLAIAFKPDGSRLASAGSDKEVKIWDLETGEQIRTIGNHSGAINDLAWSSDGKKLITVCDDGTARLCDEAKDAPERTLPAADDVLYAVAVSADGKTIFAGGHDGRVYVWRDGKLQTKFDPSEVKTAAATPE